MLRRTPLFFAVCALISCGSEPSAPPEAEDELAIELFEASQSSVEYGERVRLRWRVRGARAIEIATRSVTLVSTFAGESMVETDPLLEETRFELIARNEESSKTASVDIAVSVPPPMILSFQPSTFSPYVGGLIDLTWHTMFADSVRLLEDGVELRSDLPPRGRFQARATKSNTTYELFAAREGIEVSAKLELYARTISAIDSFLVTPSVLSGADPVRVGLTWSIVGTARTELFVDRVMISSFGGAAAGDFSLELDPVTEHELTLRLYGADERWLEVSRFAGPPVHERETNDFFSQDLNNATAVLGELDSATDVDQFRYPLRVSSQKRLHVWITTESGSGCAVDATLAFQEQEMLLAEDDDDGEGACPDLHPDRDPALGMLNPGTQTITVRSARGSTGRYLLMLQPL
jgi:hypothetical protein